ncbi:BON domain-containing protein [Variovorax fucosicus]|uniref:BON domain-containing protein n=1 Tax=Variovorax fucosicus TaxID=3053517 RepID=UPI00257597A0|nr:BON domain-containing protein [Variovorax sp. J22G47]MDM0055616.1 BON domain-containing protein [Variovorax sp. J22G47]
MTMTSTQRLACALTAGAALVAGLAGCVPLVIGGAAVAGAGMVATDRRTSGAQLDDQGIELRGAARVRDIANDDMNVTVISFNRQVLLVGTVGNEGDRRRVEDSVSRVDNVRSVVNEITVGPGSTLPQRSNDAFITGKVKASLLDQKDIFANAFKVVTERGVVYLMGIATRREVDRATDITRGVPGVQKVVRVVEVVSDADLAATQARQGGTGAPPPPVQDGASSSSARVPLPPMAPLPSTGGTAAPAPAGSGVTTTPVR